MIIALSIRSFVLIDRLDIDASDGFTALTGETGAGKSIILDALGLALGASASKRFVRKGEDQASVTCEFALAPDSPVWAMLDERGIDADAGETLTLKRIVKSNGPARAFVNDQSVSAALLQEVGDCLVEVHGQHSASDLMRPQRHLELLDQYAGNDKLLAECAEAWARLSEARAARIALEQSAETAEAERQALAEQLDDLETLSPVPGEAEKLAGERNLLLQSERILESVADAQAALGEADVEGHLARASRAVERILRIPGVEEADGAWSDAARAACEAVERAMIEAGEACASVERLASLSEHDPDALERSESRLFALRAAARRYEIEADELPVLLDRVRADVARLEEGGGGLEAARAGEADAAARWHSAADRLSDARRAGAARLETAIMKELKPLKLDKAQVRVAFSEIEAGANGAKGREKAEFEVETNPGAGFGPLRQIASGGELARFSLALKCALSETGGAGTLIFDEADQGVGGAVAAAIGERLRRLASGRQVFAITHSPQVAASGSDQWRVEKSAAAAGLGETRITRLDAGERLEEIARMLSGASVTQEARAAATRLLEDG